MKTASLISLVLTLIFATSMQGQESAVDEPVCNDEFAKFLVDQQVSEGRSVAETNKRIRILMRSADFLWKFDEPKSREYFAEAYKVANEHFAEKGFERKEYAGGISTQLPDYRFEVVRAIAKRDSKWAQQLADEFLKEIEKNAAKRNEMDKNREIDALMSIALDNVQTNPALSWHLFRRLMRERIESQWFWYLYSVARKDATFADALYGELLASHASASPQQLTYLAAYPFAQARLFGFESGQYFAALPENFSPRPALQAKFIDLFLRRSDQFASDVANYNERPDGYQQPDAVYIVSVLQELEPIVVQSFPSFLARHNAARSKAIAMLSDDGRKSMAERDKWKNAGTRTFDERMAEIEKADDEGTLTDAMILSVLISGLKTEEQFRRLESWLDKIGDAKGRAGSMNYFWFLRSQLAIKAKRFLDAQKFAAKVPEVEHQAILWFEMAEKQLADINDSASVHQTLSDVAKVARRAEDSVGKARVHLGLASLYEKLNHSFAISELSDAVAVINKLKDADLQTSYLLRHIRVKDMGFGASFSTPSYDLENTFTTLSKDDFSLPLSNAKALEDRFYRTIAVIAIAKNCIDKPRKKRVAN